MKRTAIKLAIGILFFSCVLIANQANVFAQGSTGASLERDPATNGSVPYAEAVSNFLSKKRPKIVGGKPAPDGAYPWQVSLGVSWIADPFYSHFCGGSIYSDRWIITAAHCAKGLTPSQIIITAGTNRLVDGSTRLNVKRIIVHKSYDNKPHDNDIALLELWDPLPVNDRIRAIPLLTPNDDPKLLIEGAPLVVTGWGATQEGGSAVRDLRYLDNLPFVERSFCNAPLSYDGRITENMICAGVASGGMDSCQGDSGGPLSVETATAPKLAGVVSWGDGCALTNKFGIYTRVANYVEWIRACVSGSAACNQ